MGKTGRAGREEGMRLLRWILVGLALTGAPSSAWAQAGSIAGSQVIITPAATAYAAGQCLGGVLTAPGLIRSGGQGGAILDGVNFVDPNHNTTANDAQTIWIFNVQPVGTYTNQLACSLAAADIPNLVGFATILAGNCFTDTAASTTCTINPNLAVSPAATAYPIATSATSAAGSFLLTFASVPTYIVPGMLVADTTTPAAITNGATITATTATTVTINQPVNSPGVGSGDTIVFTRTIQPASNALWFVPIASAAPTYGANKLTYTFMTQLFGN